MNRKLCLLSADTRNCKPIGADKLYADIACNRDKQKTGMHLPKLPHMHRKVCQRASKLKKLFEMFFI